MAAGVEANEPDKQNLEGVMWARVKNRPYEARYEWIHSRKLPSGEILEQIEEGWLYRDSEGRERIEKRTADQFEPLESTEIYDPVSERHSLLIGSSQVFSFSSEESLTAEGMGDFYATTFSIGDGSAIVLPHARQEPTGLHIGEKEVGGMTCKGYRIVNQNRCVIEYWIATDLQEILQISIVTGTTESKYRVFDIHLRNPDKSIFALPADVEGSR